MKGLCAALKEQNTMLLNIAIVLFMTVPLPTLAAEIWTPTSDTTWQYQLEGPTIDTSVDVSVFNIDLTNSAAKVAALQAKGHKVICYFSAATNETFRKDSDQFPDEVQGEIYEDWRDEAWLNIRELDVLKPIMLSRIDECRAKGFDGVEFDDMDIYNYQTVENGEVIRTGTNFNIQPEDSVTYFRWLASEAHDRGLAVGLKNSPEILSDVIDLIDFMIVDDCYAEKWCHKATLPLSVNKPVFMVEYTDKVNDFDSMCKSAISYRYNAILRNRRLNPETFQACPSIIKAVKEKYVDIVADGLIDDWNTVEFSYADPIGDANAAGVDYQSIKISHDRDNIYMLVSFDAETDWMLNEYNSVLIDTDNQVSTGFKVEHIGSEMQIRLAGAFSQKGGDWLGAEMGGGTITVVPSIDRKHWEVEIPKSLTHPDGAPLLNSSVLNIVLVSYDTEGNVRELAPDNSWMRFVIEDIPAPVRSFSPDLISIQPIAEEKKNSVSDGGGATNSLLLAFFAALLSIMLIRKFKAI